MAALTRTTLSVCIVLLTLATAVPTFAEREAGDFDGDGYVNLGDFLIIHDCLAGPDVAVEPPCTSCDLDTDSNVDLLDLGVFQGLFTGAFEDCNENGVPDSLDIAQGTSQDCNANGIPDECELGGSGEACQFPVTVIENETEAPDSTYLDVPDDNYGGLTNHHVTYYFDCAIIVDEDGPDLNVYEVDWGAMEFQFVDVLVSADGVTYTSIKSSEVPVIRIRVMRRTATTSSRVHTTWRSRRCRPCSTCVSRARTCPTA